MERKIREIFEYNGEWYQCIEDTERISCINCCFYNGGHKLCTDESMGNCVLEHRSDKKSVCFKKLEKVGEPYMLEDKKFQKYKAFKTPYIYHKIDCSWQSFADPYYISLEIKENMEEKKLIELLSEKVHNAWMKEKEAQGFSYGKDYDKEKKKHPDMLPYNELKEEVKEYDRATVRAVLQAQKELQSKYNYNNLKPFDLEAAKAGKPVCTRDGRKARIICFDCKDQHYPIVALIECDDTEVVQNYSNKGEAIIGNEWDKDLMMLTERRSGWAKIRKDVNLYNTKEEADRKMIGNDEYVTAKVCWEG